MEKHLGKDYANKAQREAFLKDNCATVENKGYMKSFKLALDPLLAQRREMVSELMNFSATVNNKIERAVKENGDRTDNFAQVVNSNLPASFTLDIPIFKGMDSETLEVETFAQINGREVAFTLLSPGANQTLEDVRDRAIDDQLAQIKEIAPKIAIIEI